ncbi:DNA helicase UvrB [Bacteroides sp. 214]|uniref:bifunctional nuclease family protein n=1 Tax=Bacteroides sp. 214 TaxID=2302935 RepID=UPI0013D4664D|nr:bifunctional nuclease family protein [Bacteroides sp. 214]NDW13217.1 DNA helicase UvrB [Bacteroides sp. 214]
MNDKIELRVVSISNSQEQASAFALVLQEVGGNRQLPIIIGPSEAQSIALHLKGIKPPRPLTHDLFATTLDEFNILVEKIHIYRAKDGVFFSYIYFRSDNQAKKIDSRTSDAIGIALRFNAPIYIESSILAEEGFTPSEEITNEELVEEDAAAIHKEDQLTNLKLALEKAIQDENYELASVLRDEIARRQ